MIIVEGPDGAGKTTLLNKLAETLSLQIAPRVVSKETEAEVNLVQWTEDNLKLGFQTKTIYDRHRLISDPIYRSVMGKPIDDRLYNPKWMLKSVRKLSNIRPIIVWCLPPLEVMRANLADDPDNARIYPHIDQLYMAYLARICSDVTNPRGFSFWYDYTLDPDGEEVEQIAELIDLETDRRVAMANYYPTLGATHA